MGSWNSSCGLTQLPIEGGDKVRLFVLVNNLYTDPESNKTDFKGGGTCYTNEYWMPLGPPIQGIYDTYGGIEKIKNTPDNNLLLDKIKSKFSLSDEKERFRVDGLPKNLSKMTLKRALRSIERGLGCWNTYDGAKTLGQMLVLEDCYQAAINYNPIVTKRNEDLSNEMYEYVPQSVKIDYWLKNWYENTSKGLKILSTTINVEEMSVGEIFELYSGDSLFNYNVEYSKHYKKIIIENMKNNVPFDDINVKSTFNTLKEMFLFDSFMTNTRKFYSPQTGMGSQNYELEPYIALNECVAKIISERDRIHREENVVEECDEDGYYDYMLEQNAKVAAERKLRENK